jgi:hypothetical protein
MLLKKQKLGFRSAALVLSLLVLSIPVQCQSSGQDAVIERLLEDARSLIGESQEQTRLAFIEHLRFPRQDADKLFIVAKSLDEDLQALKTQNEEKVRLGVIAKEEVLGARKRLFAKHQEILLRSMSNEAHRQLQIIVRAWQRESDALRERQ